MRHGKTEKAIQAAVEAARTGQSVRIVSTKGEARRLNAMLAKHDGASLNGSVWEFGSGSVEVVT